MINNKNDLSATLIVDKMRALTESIYVATKELPCNQFGTILSILMTMYCDQNCIDILQFLEALTTVTLDESKDDNSSEQTE